MDEHINSFTISAGEDFLRYADKIKYGTRRNNVPVYIYCPRFIPLFAVFSIFLYGILEKFIIDLNCLGVLVLFLLTCWAAFSEQCKRGFGVRLTNDYSCI